MAGDERVMSNVTLKSPFTRRLKEIIDEEIFKMLTDVTLKSPFTRRLKVCFESHREIIASGVTLKSPFTRRLKDSSRPRKYDKSRSYIEISIY